MLAWLSVWSKMQICIWPSWCHCHLLSLASVNTIGYTFLVLAHPDSPGKGLLNGCLITVVDNYNNKPLTIDLSKTVWVNHYQEWHRLLTGYLCGYCSISLVNFLYLLLSIAFSLFGCLVRQFFSQSYCRFSLASFFLSLTLTSIFYPVILIFSSDIPIPSHPVLLLLMLSDQLN